jgi:predicted nucleic acid-binding protein
VRRFILTVELRHAINDGAERHVLDTALQPTSQTIGQLAISEEQSLFREQLLREDVARFAKLRDLAHSVKDLEASKRAARRIGWTQGDTRTNELAEPLDALLEAVFAYQTGTTVVGQEPRHRDAWLELHRVRMERLVGCLSTPVPRSID